MKNLKSRINYQITNKAKSFIEAIYGKCAVLLYHRVIDIENDPQLLCVKPDNFIDKIKLLKEKFSLISIEEFEYIITKKKKFRKNSVAITFDDGYADNYYNALPILESFNCQALFFIATATLNTEKEFWWDALERIILLTNKTIIDEKYEFRNRVYHLKFNNIIEQDNLYKNHLIEFKKFIGTEREKRIDILSHIFNKNNPRTTHRAMTFDELNKLSLSNAAIIGAHTHSHPSLGALSYIDQFNEIKMSKDIVEKIIKKEVIHFSYPFGTYHDYNKNSIEICKKLNLNIVAANYPSLLNVYSNFYAYPRFIVRDWDKNKFSYMLRKIFNIH